MRKLLLLASCVAALIVLVPSSADASGWRRGYWGHYRPRVSYYYGYGYGYGHIRPYRYAFRGYHFRPYYRAYYRPPVWVGYARPYYGGHYYGGHCW